MRNIKTLSGIEVAAGSAKAPEIVGTTQQAFRDDFPGSALLDSKWELIQLGAGMSLNIAAGSLTIACGTTADSETILRSRATFSIPVLLLCILNLSQRIANQEFYLELVTESGQHAAGWKLDGTSATQGRYFNTNTGMTSTSAASTISTTASTAILEIEAFRDETYFHSRTLNGARAQSFLLQTNVPDPAAVYFIQIRAKNLGIAPASNTNLVLDAVSALDISDLAVEVIGGRGGIQSAQCIPMWSTGGTLATVAAITQAGNLLTFYNDSTTNLGAGATFTGTSRDSSSTPRYGKFRAGVFSAQAGTLRIDQSRDGSAWRETKSAAHPGGSAATQIEDTIFMRYVRVVYVNGGVAQTSMDLNSALVAT